MFDSPVVSTGTVFAVRWTTTALLKRAAWVARLRSNTSRGFSSICGILVVLIKAGGRVPGELKIGGVRGSLGRVLVSRAEGDLLCPFRSLGCWGWLALHTASITRERRQKIQCSGKVLQITERRWSLVCLAWGWRGVWALLKVAKHKRQRVTTQKVILDVCNTMLPQICFLVVGKCRCVCRDIPLVGQNKLYICELRHIATLPL